ncbi:MAG: hypothetical protein UX80_C0005G0050 [Candidatus Amesbacteria bacterium GW2011_GWA2_47_11b]|uniref:DUF2079 domain-containing protein n=2 Tax=Candidatus Amesiibacteriota TaxID=1752730 RepID=A0A0G1SLC4_9BACT|nr:MAG: hypothetical protein UX42_C0001G0107 [Microgenomates group bacterium GW2011_GWC1_46_20]KKU58230.1 MAG: hypothetical protein UX80_C0005G0050 [Candidatus Amesbacteria bacterium GW2011_GWA2_47_11b]KKU70294.1 MAG: hypothetical protein UX92_C0002G0038 [Candidatus Amesbacteria bacterium GW2011_GWA1_47_20]
MKKLTLLILIVIKLYLLLNIGQTTDYFLHSYRAWTLLRFGRDEVGNVLPYLFHGPAGYQFPLTSYLFVPFGVLGFEFLVWLLPAMLLAVAFSSPTLGLVFLATPAFLWPGNYDAKLVVLFLSLLIAALKRKKFIIPAVILTIAAALALKPSFVSQSLITTINSLRGEHSAFPLLAKILHNKLYFVLVYLQNIFSALNPSFLFGFGDKAQKIPPLLIILLPFLFRRPSKLIAVLAIASLLLAGFGITPFPFYLSLILMAGRYLPRVAVYLGLVLLLPMAYFSTHFLPHRTWVDRGWGLSEVINLASSPVLLADDVYPDPGPYLAFHLRPVPPSLSKNSYHFRDFIRRIGLIEVVSPDDPRLQSPGPISLVSAKWLGKHPLQPKDTFEPVVYDPFGTPVLFRLHYYVPTN